MFTHTIGDIDIYTQYKKKDIQMINDDHTPYQIEQSDLYNSIENYSWDRVAQQSKHYTLHYPQLNPIDSEEEYSGYQRALFNFVRTYKCIIQLLY